MLDIGWCLLPLASCHVSRLLDGARCSLHASTMTRGVFCFSARHCWRSSRRLSWSLSNGERYTATQNNNVPAMQRTNADRTSHNLQRASNVVETVSQAGSRSLRKEAVQSAFCSRVRARTNQTKTELEEKLLQLGYHVQALARELSSVRALIKWAI